MKKLFFDMDGVLVDFQSGIDKLSEETKHGATKSYGSLATLATCSRNASP